MSQPCYVARVAVFKPPPGLVLCVNFFVPIRCRCRGYCCTIWHSVTHTPVGLVWTRDRSVAETCTLPHTTFTQTDIHIQGGIRTRNPSKRSAADPHIHLGICCCSKMHICCVICRSFVRWFERVEQQCMSYVWEPTFSSLRSACGEEGRWEYFAGYVPKFSLKLGATQNSRRQKDDVMWVSNWRHTNIRRQRTEAPGARRLGPSSFCCCVLWGRIAQ